MILIRIIFSLFLAAVLESKINPPFNGPYYVEAMFYIDYRNMPLREEDFKSIALQVDLILKDPSFPIEAYFVLKGIRPYNDIVTKGERYRDIFCQNTAQARLDKKEDVSYLISANERKCLANGEVYKKPVHKNLTKVCASLGGRFYPEKSNCNSFQCFRNKLEPYSEEYLDYQPCKRARQRTELSRSETGSWCQMKKCNLIHSSWNSWSSWSSWSPCNYIIGYSERNRTCEKPNPNNLGRCQGAKVDYKECNRHIGCDLKLSSTAKSDNCKFCKGDDSCKLFEDEKEIEITNGKT
ncbi:unnamed protein product [Gordionus sp. m RMFG-2023]